MVIISRLCKWLKKNYSFIFNKKIIVILLIVGILLRLVLMPFTMMTDLTHYSLRGYDFIKNTPVHNHLSSSSVFFYFNYAFLSIYNIFMPVNNWVDFSAVRNTNSTDFMEITYAIETNFLSHSSPFLKIFLLKLPYFLLDLGVLLVLPLFFQREEGKRFAFLFWLFNPVALITSFVFGVNDVLGVFLLILGFYQLSRERFLWAFLFLALSVFSKFSALLALPFVLVFMIKKYSSYGNSDYDMEKIKKRFRLKLTFIFLVATAVFFAILSKDTFKYGIKKWPANYFFATAVGEIRLIYLFVLVYSLIIIAYAYFSDDRFQNLWRFSLLGMLSFFALCFFHPQWFLVAMPFMLFAIMHNKKLLWLFISQLAFYFAIFLHWSNHLTVNLLAPINPSLFLSMPDIKSQISLFFDATTLINIFWTIFIAITLFLMYLVAKSFSSELEQARAKKH